MSSPSEISQALLAAERTRDDCDESTNAAELLARIHATVLARSKTHPARGTARWVRRPITLLAAALILGAGAALDAYGMSHSEVLSSGANQVPAAGGASFSPPPELTPSSTFESRSTATPVPVESLPSVVPTTSARPGWSTPPPGGPAASGFAAEHATEVVASEEAELIARARTAFDAGAIDEAMRLLYLHERKFQHPKLSEDREILFVRTFAAARRTTEARQRFARFTKAYPSSPAIPALARIVDVTE